MTRLTLLLAFSAAPVFAQLPNTPQPNMPPIPNAVAAASPTASSTSRISHVVVGPAGRVQGLLLHNGTFVSLSPALSQQLPISLRHHSSVTVSGPTFGSGSDRTIQAQQLNIAGVAYSDSGVGGGPAAVPPQPSALAAAPPPPPAGAPGLAPPPPPPPAGAPGLTPPPPPPPAGAPGLTPPPTRGVPPPPPSGSAAPPAMRPNGIAPAPPTNMQPPPNLPAPPTDNAPQSAPPTKEN